MQIPLAITFQDLDRSEWSERFIRRQVQRLDRYAEHIIACRVTIAQPHRHQHRGRPFQVRVEVSVPPRHILDAVAEPVAVDTIIDLRTVIRDAFKAMEKRLLKLKRMQRGEIKRHATPTALVTRIFPADGYGFLTTFDGQEIYFHHHAVLHDRFAQLSVGTEVRFEAEEEETGPQATTVSVIGPLHARGAGAPTRDISRDISLEW